MRLWCEEAVKDKLEADTEGVDCVWKLLRQSEAARSPSEVLNGVHLATSMLTSRLRGNKPAWTKRTSEVIVSHAFGLSG